MLGDKIRDTSCSTEKRITLLYNTQLHAANSTELHKHVKTTLLCHQYFAVCYPKIQQMQ